jgi:hypothetical protein
VVTSPVARQKKFLLRPGRRISDGKFAGLIFIGAAKLAREHAIDVAERGWVKGCGCSSADAVVRHEQFFRGHHRPRDTEA